MGRVTHLDLCQGCIHLDTCRDCSNTLRTTEKRFAVELEEEEEVVVVEKADGFVTSEDRSLWERVFYPLVPG